MFDSLPKNQLSKLYEPDSSHLGAPSASIEEIVTWTTAVAGSKPVIRPDLRDKTAQAGEFKRSRARYYQNTAQLSINCL